MSEPVSPVEFVIGFSAERIAQHVGRYLDGVMLERLPHDRLGGLGGRFDDGRLQPLQTVHGRLKLGGVQRLFGRLR